MFAIAAESKCIMLFWCPCFSLLLLWASLSTCQSLCVAGVTHCYYPGVVFVNWKGVGGVGTLHNPLIKSVF
jgi:hypothetical protein